MKKLTRKEMMTVANRPSVTFSSLKHQFWPQNELRGGGGGGRHGRGKRGRDARKSGRRVRGRGWQVTRLCNEQHTAHGKEREGEESGARVNESCAALGAMKDPPPKGTHEHVFFFQ